MSHNATLTDAIKSGFFELMKSVNTSIMGRVIDFDASDQTATIQIQIRRIDKTGEAVTPPPLIRCPVHFPGGNNYIIEHEVNAGDEGLVIFSQRSIDTWLNEGGINSPLVVRFHSKDDACFIPGFRSNPNAVSDFSNDGIRLRNNDASQYFHLKSDGKMEAKCTDFNVIANTFTHNGVNVGDDHVHGGVASGGSNTDGPQ